MLTSGRLYAERFQALGFLYVPPCGARLYVTHSRDLLYFHLSALWELLPAPWSLREALARSLTEPERTLFSRRRNCGPEMPSNWSQTGHSSVSCHPSLLAAFQLNLSSYTCKRQVAPLPPKKPQLHRNPL